VSNGKILITVDTKMSFIYDLEYKDGICAVVGIMEDGNTKFIALKYFLFDDKVKFILVYNKFICTLIFIVILGFKRIFISRK
jgi:hypothetical protein